MLIWSKKSVFYSFTNLLIEVNMISSKGVYQVTTEEKNAKDHSSKHFSKKRGLTEHHRKVRKGVKYSYGQCGKQFSEKGNLDQHQRAVHESNTLAAYVNIKRLQGVVLLNTTGEYMKESNTLAGNAANISLKK